MERQVFDLVRDAGATDQEATCLAVALTAEVDELTDVFTITNLGDDRSEPLGARGRACGFYDRLNEIAQGLRREAEQETDVFVGRVVRMLVDELLAVGATRDEAQCIAEAWFDTSSDPLDEDARAERLAECGSERRVDALFEQRRRTPLIEGLVGAGATADEANCIVDHVEDVDIYFPSDGFEGPSAAETTAQRLAGKAASCGTPERIRGLAFALHGQSVP